MSNPRADQDVEAQQAGGAVANTPQAVDRYRDMALGMYLYWTVDAQFGMVNAHSVIGASADYLQRYFNELPRTFNPEAFDAAWYARLAVLCGFDYVTVTPKNHNGFCMWDTRTTPFSVMNTPLGRDVTGEFTDALRAVGLPVSFYFSPDDAWYQWTQGREPARRRPWCLPTENPGLLEHDKAQLRELIERYRPDMLCFDHKPEVARPLVEFARSVDPQIMVTRGALPTPEQALDAEASGPFEAHYTVGTQWQYRVGHDRNKTGRQLVELLADIRSRGGTLLLAIGGPDADGRLPRDKDDLVREVGLWLFINREAVRGVRPWRVQREGPVYYTMARDGGAVYAIDCAAPERTRQWRTVRLEGVRATASSTIEVLGQSGNVLEYCLDVEPRTTWHQADDGLYIHYCRAQRLTNDLYWPNPMVLKITNPEQGEAHA